MIDETFGEIEYSEDYGYIGRKNIPFGGNENSVEITVMCDDEEEGISPFQRNAYETLMQGWDEIQHRTTGTDPVVLYLTSSKRLRNVYCTQVIRYEKDLLKGWCGNCDSIFLCKICD